MKFVGTVIVVILLILLAIIMQACSNKNETLSSEVLTIQTDNYSNESVKSAIDISSILKPSQLLTISPKKVKKNIKIPILLYHSVTDNTFGIKNLHVSPSEFDMQMKYLKD